MSLKKVINKEVKKRKHKKRASPQTSGRIAILRQQLCQKYCWFCPRPSWSRVSSAVVRHAPCFFCADKLETSATDRMLLTRLNVLCAILGFGQFGVGVFILIAFLSQSIVDRDIVKIVDYAEKALAPNLW